MPAMVKYERITLCSSCKTLGARSKTTGAPEQESLHGGIGALTSADCTQAFAAEHRGQRLGWVRVGEDSSPHSSHGDGAPPHACSGVQAPNAEGPTEAPGRPQTVARMSMDPRRKRRTGRGRKSVQGVRGAVPTSSSQTARATGSQGHNGEPEKIKV